MPTTLLPGFEEITRDSQQTFRTLLTALSEPGKKLEIPVSLTPPAGLTPACAAACLTLMDLETTVWIQPDLQADSDRTVNDHAVRNWLRFHTGCRFVDAPTAATFAVIVDIESLSLNAFNWGSPETPEASTTLLIQLSSLQTGEPVMLSGPGILSDRQISPALPTGFWSQWADNHQAYPRGVDCFLFDQQAVLGLPRTAQAKQGEKR